MKHFYKHEAKGFSLRLGLLGIVAGCWVLPMALVLSSLIYYTNRSISRHFETTVSEAAASAAISCRQGIGEAVAASRRASYDRRIRGAYLSYKNTENSQALYDTVTAYLQENYQYDNNFVSTAVFFLDEPDSLFYTFNPLSASYSNVIFYQAEAHGAVLGASRRLGTRIAFIAVGERLYMVRNIVDTNYTTFAVIVNEMNRDIITDSFSGVLWVKGATVYLNGTMVNTDSLNTGAVAFPDNVSLPPRGRSVIGGGDTVGIYGRENTDGVDISYAVEVDRREFLQGFFSFINVIYVLLALTVPLILLAVRFFYRNIFRPVNGLTYAAGRIQDGDLGYEVAERAGNREFNYLMGAFNGMSVRLKQQFERIYSEELALRDARIMALQSQINPHFLNNTLEIINWEVRLGNNEVVSKLIEALSIMLDAAMDRENAPLITLEREMEYVDSYLYIISERFGKRLTVIKNIDPGILESRVPRFILQPIIENAVEHGADRAAHGEIEITGKQTDGKITVSVRNNTAMTDRDRRLVGELLSPDAPANGGGSPHLGIRNVDTRLKMIYGEGVGLSITSDGENTTSSFTVPSQADYPTAP